MGGASLRASQDIPSILGHLVSGDERGASFRIYEVTEASQDMLGSYMNLTLVAEHFV